MTKYVIMILNKRKEVSKMFKQQGDVIIESVDQVDGKEFSPNGGILVEGEFTGHAHRILDQNVKYFKNENGELFLEVFGNVVALKHEEHKTIKIPKGKFRIRRVREYDHFLEESRNVTD